MEQLESDIAEGNISYYGERYTVNSKSKNRYHANWMNMMYPRIKIAKDLMTDDGVFQKRQWKRRLRKEQFIS